MATEYASSGEYIKHHLQNLTLGKLPEGYERHDHHGNVEGALGQGMPAIHVTDVSAAAAEVMRRFGLA